jgi:transposase
MSPAFIKGAADNFSQAKVTFDKFHVMKAVNKAVDQVRRNEQSDNKELKRTRYIWLKNKKNLTKKQKEKLKSLSEMNLKTMRAYNLRLSLQEFWNIDDLTTAASYLQKWYLWEIRSQLEPMVDIGRFIKKDWEGVMNYIESHINNGILEGLNSIFQIIKRKDRCFRNLNNFMTAIYLQCGKLDFDLPKAFI